MASATDVLTDKYAGIPGYGWVGIVGLTGGAGLLLLRRIRGKSGGNAAGSLTTADTTATKAGQSSAGVGSGSSSGGGSSPGSGPGSQTGSQTGATPVGGGYFGGFNNGANNTQPVGAGTIYGQYPSDEGIVKIQPFNDPNAIVTGAPGPIQDPSPPSASHPIYAKDLVPGAAPLPGWAGIDIFKPPPGVNLATVDFSQAPTAGWGKAA